MPEKQTRDWRGSYRVRVLCTKSDARKMAFDAEGMTVVIACYTDDLYPTHDFEISCRRIKGHDAFSRLKYAIEAAEMIARHLWSQSETDADWRYWYEAGRALRLTFRSDIEEAMFGADMYPLTGACDGMFDKAFHANVEKCVKELGLRPETIDREIEAWVAWCFGWQQGHNEQYGEEDE